MRVGNRAGKALPNTCPKCGEVKDETDFNPSWPSRCKPCVARYNKNRRNLPHRKAYHLEANRKLHQKYKLIVISHYGGKCECCGEDNIGFLTIDHINGDGKEHRNSLGSPGSHFYKRLIDCGFPKDPPLRVLCYNCNCGRYTHGGICPHGLAGKGENL